MKSTDLTHLIKEAKQTYDQGSEISFFYEEGDEEDDLEADQDIKNSKFILIQGAHRVGKEVNMCEDAYFYSDRAFGVSDGVSGWNEYGFSSDQFSLQIMINSKIIIDKYFTEGHKDK